MKSSNDLITAARSLSRNSANPDGTYSVPDSEILQYLNDGQDRIQNLISATKNIAKIFVYEKIISIVANQAEYSVPDRVLLNKQIEYVEYSATGQVQDYIRLEKLNFFNRDTYPSTYPMGYFKRGNQILLQPTPSAAQGSLRINYEREVYDLDVVRSQINGVPGAGATMTLDAVGGTLITTASGALLTLGTKVCITKSDGTPLLLNGVVASYVAGTKVLTLAANVSTYLVGTAVLADLASQYFTIGAYTTPFSQLPDNCERYLIHYAVAELFHRDSSNDYSKELDIISTMEEDIVKTMAAQTGEIQFTPQISRYEWWVILAFMALNYPSYVS